MTTPLALELIKRREYNLVINESWFSPLGIYTLLYTIYIYSMIRVLKRLDHPYFVSSIEVKHGSRTERLGRLSW